MIPRPAFGLLVLLAGCSGPAEQSFRCPDGTELGALFRDDSVRLRLPEGVATLPAAVSASGARYANDTIVFWEHQGAALVERNGQTLYTDCRPV